jgi:putative addiction module component (TIGR02574 family)
MAGDFQSVCDAALALSEDERVLLVQRLLDTLPPGACQYTEDELAEELDRRAEEARRDPSALIPWEEVRRRLRQP